MRMSCNPLANNQAYCIRDTLACGFLELHLKELVRRTRLSAIVFRKQLRTCVLSSRNPGKFKSEIIRTCTNLALGEIWNPKVKHAQLVAFGASNTVAEKTTTLRKGHPSCLGNIWKPKIAKV
jgi:hypothetical protein